MSQSMNGMSFYGNGISETDNITCNNLSCNNISSNGILTNTLTSQQITTTAINATSLTGTTANLSGSITGQNGILCSSGDITATLGNIRASYHLSGELLNLQGSILTNKLVDNLQGLDKNIKTELNLIRKNCSNLGIDNLILGARGGPNLNSSSSNNISLGADSLPHCEGGSQNIAIGQYALSNVYNSYNCIGIGYQAGEDPATAGTTYSSMEKSVAIGYQAKFLNSNEIVLGTASETTIIKGELQCSKDIHCQNLFIDYGGGVFLDYYILANLQGLTYNVEATFNKFAKDCGNSLTSGLNNAIFGNFGLPYLTTGSENVGIGHETGLSLINGSRNVFMGTFAGQYVRGNDNISIGTQAGQDSDPAYSNLVFSNSIAIGKNSAFYDNNQIVLGSSLHETVIQGTMNVIQTAEFKQPIVCNSTPTLLNHLTNRAYVESYMNSVASFLTPYSSFNALQTVVSSLSLQLSTSLAKNKNGVFIPSPSTNGQKTVVFSTPFPAGSAVTLITSLEFTGGVIGTIQVSSITNASFKYDILSTSSTHIESFVTVHWMAMI
jgi:hypothetical protein